MRTLRRIITNARDVSAANRRFDAHHSGMLGDHFAEQPAIAPDRRTFWPQRRERMICGVCRSTDQPRPKSL